MKWITIETVDNEGKKTEVFEVFSKENHCPLGIIKWIAGWHKYAFFPYESSYYEWVCLRDIAEFIEEKTREYKKDWFKG